MKIRLVICLLILSLGIGSTCKNKDFSRNIKVNEVEWPMYPSPLPEFPKYTTVFGVPVFATSDYTVSLQSAN